MAVDSVTRLVAPLWRPTAHMRRLTACARATSMRRAAAAPLRRTRGPAVSEGAARQGRTGYLERRADSRNRGISHGIDRGRLTGRRSAATGPQGGAHRGIPRGDADAVRPLGSGVHPHPSGRRGHPTGRASRRRGSARTATQGLSHRAARARENQCVEVVRLRRWSATAAAGEAVALEHAMAGAPPASATPSTVSRAAAAAGGLWGSD
jgi:hypothetical protein